MTEENPIETPAPETDAEKIARMSLELDSMAVAYDALAKRLAESQANQSRLSAELAEAKRANAHLVEAMLPQVKALLNRVIEIDTDVPDTAANLRSIQSALYAAKSVIRSATVLQQI